MILFAQLVLVLAAAVFVVVAATVLVAHERQNPAPADGQILTVVFHIVPETVTGPFAGHVYRVLPDRDTDHAQGLVVFLDDAERILNDAQIDAYANGRKDQLAGDEDDDPEQDDAFPDVTDRPVLSNDTRARLAGGRAARMTIDPDDIIPLDSELGGPDYG